MLEVHVQPTIYISYSEKPNKMQQCIKILLLLILNEAQHVLDDTPPIMRSLNCISSLWICIILWKVAGHAVVGRCQVAYVT